MCVGKKKKYKKIQLPGLELGQNTFTNTSIHEKRKKKVILNDHKWSQTLFYISYKSQHIQQRYIPQS